MFCFFVAVCRSLKSDRDPVDEIAAVYFIMPTSDNIARIGKVETIEKPDELYSYFLGSC